jgi:hypothetical protein
LHPTKADRYLVADAGMERVVAKARELRSLTRACTDFLPPALARQMRAVNLRDGELSLLAANPAAAAKLKLVAESLRKFLLLQGTKVSSVSVRVQPTQSHQDAPAQARVGFAKNIIQFFVFLIFHRALHKCFLQCNISKSQGFRLLW